MGRQAIKLLGGLNQLAVDQPSSLMPFPNEGGGVGGAKALRNFQCRGVLLIWMIVGQGSIALAVGES